MKTYSENYFLQSDLDNIINALTQLNISYELTDGDEFLSIGKVTFEYTEEQQKAITNLLK